MTKYSVILGNLGNTNDRFLSTGYKDQPPKEEMIREAANIEGVSGIELVGTWDITPDNADQIAAVLKANGLRCVSIIPDLFSQKRWGNGSLSAKDPSIRAQAVDATREAAENARKVFPRLLQQSPMIIKCLFGCFVQPSNNQLAAVVPARSLSVGDW